MLRDQGQLIFSRLGGECQVELDGLMTWLSGDLSVSRTTAPAGTSFSAQFASWLDLALTSRSIGRERREQLVPAATNQVMASLALRAIAAQSWRASRGLITAMDAALTGSTARWEASYSSDFDFDFVAADDAELAANSLPIGAIVDKLLEDQRTAVLGRSAWWTAFVAAGSAYYDFSADNHLAYTLSVPEFDRARMPSATWFPLAFERYGSNYLSSTFALRATAARFAEVRAKAAKIGRYELALKKIDAAESYLGQLRADPRPHPAHGVVSQLWQALLYFVYGADGAAWPYWCAPLVFHLNDRELRQWSLLMIALDAARTGGPQDFAVNTAMQGLGGLFDSANKQGSLRATAYARLKNVVRPNRRSDR